MIPLFWYSKGRGKVITTTLKMNHEVLLVMIQDGCQERSVINRIKRMSGPPKQSNTFLMPGIRDDLTGATLKVTES